MAPENVRAFYETERATLPHQPKRRFVRGEIVSRCGDRIHVGRKRIAEGRQRPHVAWIVDIVTKGVPQLRHKERQVAVRDENAWPQDFTEFTLGDRARMVQD